MPDRARFVLPWGCAWTIHPPSSALPALWEGPSLGHSPRTGWFWRVPSGMLCPPPVPRLVSEDGDWEGLCVPLQTGHGPGLAPRTARCLSPAVGTPRWPGSQQVVPAAVCSPAPVLPVVWGHCARLWRCVGSDHCAPGWTVIWGGTIDCEVVCVGVPCSEQSLGLARPSTCLKLIPPAQTRFLGFCILGMCFPLVPNGPQASLGNRLWTRMSLGPHGVFSELQWPAEESRRSSPLFLDLSPPPPILSQL